MAINIINPVYTIFPELLYIWVAIFVSHEGAPLLLKMIIIVIAKIKYIAFIKDNNQKAKNDRKLNTAKSSGHDKNRPKLIEFCLFLIT